MFCSRQLDHRPDFLRFFSVFFPLAAGPVMMMAGLDKKDPKTQLSLKMTQNGQFCEFFDPVLKI